MTSKERIMKKYQVRIKRKNGTKIEIEADAVSINGNRIAFFRTGETPLWTKLDNVEIESVNLKLLDRKNRKDD